MRYLFFPPVFSDPENTEKANTLFTVVWFSVLLALGAMVALIRSGSFFRAFTPLIVLTPMGLIVLALNRRGWIRFASWLFIATIIALTSFRALVSGGIRSPGVTMFYVFALATGLLLGESAGIVVGVVCGLLGLGLVAAEKLGALPRQSIHYEIFALWWINIIYIGLTLFLVSRASRSLRAAFDRAQADLLERRKAEEKAIAIKTQLETLITEARIGIVVLQDFKPVIANRELGQMLGYNNEMEILDAPDIRAFFPEEDQAHITRLAEAWLGGEVPRQAIQLKCVRKDGTRIDIESRSFPITWNGKQSICSMVTDITQQLEFEARLRQLQKLEAVGHMTGGIAHDFNNLLTVILSNSTFLESQIQLDRLLKDMAGLITRAAERGADLTKKLLVFSRRQNLDLRVVDINAATKGMEPLLRSACSDIQIQIFFSPASCPARVDVSELENALLNLAVNARDAMPNGGVLTVEIKPVRLDSEACLAIGFVNESAKSEFILISVSDTGIGMDKKTVSQVFDPFFTTKDIGKGSGLGLSMVYGFITQLGGHIRINSELGRGTTVELYLPHEEHETLQAVSIQKTADPQGGKERILVVEDDEIVREQVVLHFTTLGYQTVAANDGIEALAILEERQHFDLLFTDILMPRGLNGIDLAKRIRSLYPQLPVLFTTGYAEVAELKDDQMNWHINLLAKPYRLQELAGKVRSILDGTIET